MLNGKLLNILLIDDDETTNFLNARTLRKAGIVKSIHIAENGKDALDYLTCYNQKIKKFPNPDLILLDINMPIMNGWDFLDAYYKLPKEKKGNIVVVMLTTSLQKEDLERAKSSKFIKELVNKPLNKKTLSDIIKKNFSAN